MELLRKRSNRTSGARQAHRGNDLATIHNLTYCHDAVAAMRAALLAGTFDRLRDGWSAWGQDERSA